jgi:formylglycine-generating enzyme required for sulfatase activity
MKKLIAISIGLMCILNVYANNITVQKVSIVDTNRVAKTASVRFSISWENSWRDSINWDAAWIFIKFRESKDSVWKYRHLTLSSIGNNASGIGTANMKFAFPSDNKGVFYYRQAMGSGKVSMDSVKLFWNYGADGVSGIEGVEVKIFATEMVYVPAGGFCIGDGNGTTRSTNSFQLKNAPNNFVALTDKWSPLINTFININQTGIDDASLYSSGIRISGLDGIDISGDKIAEYPDFPTGYRSFYCMKYEVSQGQYADFLNTLSLRDTSSYYTYYDSSRLKKVNVKYKMALQNLDPFFSSVPVDVQRHTIMLDSVEGKYSVTRPDRAFGKGTSNYYLSFSDWSALRPMSELEYEKACRGSLAPTYKSYPSGMINPSDTITRFWSGFDWAWGNDTSIAITSPMVSMISSNMQLNGIENGTEFFGNYNIYKRYNPVISQGPATYATFSGGDGGTGPYRVGIFASDTSSRISSGASYYGIMDFGKNVAQMVVSLSNSNTRFLSYKRNGDGYLNSYGRSDTNELLGDFMVNYNSFINKQSAISDRPSNNGSTFIGFRSVRSAPSDY